MSLVSTSWSTIARRHVDEAYREIKAEHPDMPDEQIMRKVSKEHYPFGERELWPYKAWLRAVKNYRQALGVVTPKDAARETPLFDNQNQ
jgi:hypothetical protein